MGKPTGSWPFVRLIIALRACPDLKNGHTNAHGQKARGNCNYKENGVEKQIKITSEKERKKKEKRGKGKDFEGTFSIGKKYFIFLRTNSV